MTGEEVVRAYFVCLDTEDWPRMRTLWADDAQLRAVGARPRHGVDEVIGYFSKLFAPWRAHVDHPARIVDAGETFTVDVVFTGTTQDGREVSFEAVDVFDLEDSRIHRLSNWYDIAYARKVVGAS